ncbi:serine O-acetyltransferase [Rubellicoccus peritrichatus]|uniref:Serine O-acetyltransferase n=1 Tax=Rubellicoccus peritrichatus TaxID=3080537 RepID=A0AAQ3QW22_9BACT|nr:serine O-acetyltransferase [Puniceicoccus sp. CR14]WOO41447.1 serine O-acetyltransferase [Puniceicoccus sp. CR14]
MTFKDYKFLVLSDLYRITDNLGIGSLFKHLIYGESFRYNFWMRTCKFSHGKRLLKYTLHPIARLIYSHYTYKMGISIPFTTDIGSGFYIGHFGGIVVNWRSTIGKNCNISHGVTLGQANRGRNKGYPIVGDDVYIGPGAKIIGAVKVGNNVAIGANCVVTKDIPDNSVVVGIPGKVISQEGSEGYVERTDYTDKIR